MRRCQYPHSRPLSKFASSNLINFFELVFLISLLLTPAQPSSGLKLDPDSPSVTVRPTDQNRLPTGIEKPPPAYSNKVGSPVIVLAAPILSHRRSKHAVNSLHEELLDFIASTAKTVLHRGRDNVIVISGPVGGSIERSLLARGVPSDVLLAGNLSNPFIRDYGPVRGIRPVRFRYRPLHLPEDAATNATKELDAFFKAYRLPMEHYSGLILDGGNVVDNGLDKAILTDRVSYDNSNRYNSDQINLMISDALGFASIATISELQEDFLGHADDAVAFLDQNVIGLGVSWGKSASPPHWIRQRTHRQVREAFSKNGGIAPRIVEMPNYLDFKDYNENDKDSKMSDRNSGRDKKDEASMDKSSDTVSAKDTNENVVLKGNSSALEVGSEKNIQDNSEKIKSLRLARSYYSTGNGIGPLFTPSACGLYTNLIISQNSLYLPQFALPANHHHDHHPDNNHHHHQHHHQHQQNEVPNFEKQSSEEFSKGEGTSDKTNAVISSLAEQHSRRLPNSQPNAKGASSETHFVSFQSSTHSEDTIPSDPSIKQDSLSNDENHRLEYLNTRHFGSLDSKVRHIVAHNTQKEVIPVHIPAAICRAGGSLRKMTWQITGPLADRLIWLARKY